MWLCDFLCKNQPSFAQKFKFIFWPTLCIAILNIYPHIMSPMTRLRWSAFLRGGYLQPYKTMTDTLTPVLHTNWALSAWNSTLDRNDVPSA